LYKDNCIPSYRPCDIKSFTPSKLSFRENEFTELPDKLDCNKDTLVELLKEATSLLILNCGIKALDMYKQFELLIIEDTEDTGTVTRYVNMLDPIPGPIKPFMELQDWVKEVGPTSEIKITIAPIELPFLLILKYGFKIVLLDISMYELAKDAIGLLSEIWNPSNNPCSIRSILLPPLLPVPLPLDISFKDSK
jgi:hypothetical protein